MKRPCFLILVVDGTRVFGAEARVGSCVFQQKVVVAQELQLMDCESEFPWEICGSEGLRGSVGHGDEGHVCREFM